MGVPASLGPRGQFGVGGGEDARREAGGHNGVDEMVEAECGQDLVDVKGEGAEGESVGEGLGRLDEGVRGWQRVFHLQGGQRGNGLMWGILWIVYGNS